MENNQNSSSNRNQQSQPQNRANSGPQSGMQGSSGSSNQPSGSSQNRNASNMTGSSSSSPSGSSQFNQQSNQSGKSSGSGSMQGRSNQQGSSGQAGMKNVQDKLQQFGNTAMQKVNSLSTTQKVIGGSLLALGAGWLAMGSKNKANIKNKVSSLASKQSKKNKGGSPNIGTR
ncbi:DNA mismatch repair ATPase MutL [Pontibacter aydingkolensis]|uniref:Uncharacterized protein n=1 Tax=Pontibacter aydingkolensis TaxID=1911536 RepID=A0ABS7CYR0_9BACT|nr:hypothetical protein [Pontibacter aydingkolensis]MBW7468826.1 hypothetical protein [Pontibacter aydingkolensis]